MDSTIRTLRPQTNKRGRPDAPCCPISAGSNQRDFDAPIPQELSLPSLEEEMLGKRSSKWQWLEVKEGKSLWK